jgi:hypothetical protein
MNTIDMNPEPLAVPIECVGGKERTLRLQERTLFLDDHQIMYFQKDIGTVALALVMENPETLVPKA